MIIRAKRVNERAKLPEYGSTSAAGMDLCANIPAGEQVVIPAGATVKVGTGVCFEIPDGFFGAVFERSGIATKRGLRPANCVGVIDSDYRGEVIVALHNDSKMDEVIFDGERIAQLVIIPYVTADKILEVDSLSDTERGAGGFGSTGRN